VKCRLRETPLARPRLAFVDQQAFPEQSTLLANRCGFYEVVPLLDQYLFDHRRITDKKSTHAAKPKPRHRTMVARSSRKKCQRILSKVLQMPGDHAAARARDR
jgi:hypothetical protein